MSALATLLIIVPLAALQPYRAAAAPQSPAQPSATARAGATAVDANEAATDRPLSQRLQSLDSARSALDANVARTGAALGTQDTARARIASSAATATAAASANAPRSASTSSTSRSTSTSRSSSTSSNSNSDSDNSSNSSSTDDDSCERFQFGNSSQNGFHMHANKDDAGKATVRYLDFDQSHCRAATINGKIVTSDNEDRIVAVLPEGSGSAYFRERTGRIDRELNVASGGAIVYRVNGTERPYDDEGRRWFAELLPRVLAEASINVEQRVKYWRSQGGADAALRHIADLRSSGAKRSHYNALLDNQLSAPELDGLVKQAGKSIPSSGDLRSVLAKAAAQQSRGRVSPSTLEDAIGAVPSSGDLTSVLLAFGRTDDREQLLAVARTALKIPSSGDLSRFLVEVAPRYLGRDDAALRAAYFKAVGNIPSSGDLARVLENATPFAAKSSAIAQSVIASSATVPASGDRSRVLVALARSGAVRSAPLRDAYLKTASEIPSSIDMRRALEALAGN